MFQKYINKFYLNQINVNFFNIFISLIVAPFIAAFIAKIINFEQNYKEFTVGTITFLGTSKNIDYFIIIGFTIGFVLSYLLINKIINSLDDDELLDFKTISLVLSLPAVVWFGNLIFSRELNVTLLILSSILQLYMILIYSVKRINTKEIAEYSLLASFFSGFSIFAWSFFSNRVLDIENLWLLKIANPYLSTRFIIVVGFLLLIYSFIFYKLEKYKNKILLLTQFSLPLLFLMLIPQKVVSNNQLISLYPINYNLYYFVLFLICIAVIFVIKRLFTKNIKFDYALSSFSLIAILFFIKSYLIIIPTASPDDYHFGEFLIPYWSLINFGQIPFVDIVPARGLINYFDGYLTSTFFELKASYFEIIKNMLMLFYVSILFFVLRKFFNIFLSFIITLSFSTLNIEVSGIDIFNTAILVLIVHFFIVKRYYMFLAMSLLFITIAILFAPGQGIILALSITPLGMYSLYKIFSYDYKIALRFLTFLLLPYILIIILTPLFDILYGAIVYAKEQSSLNSISYGIPWYFSANSFPNANYWLFEIVRSGYVFIIGLSFLILIKYFFDKKLHNRREVIVFSSIIFITSILFIIRGAGRIDPGAFSRLGLATSWIIGVLLPILIFYIFPRYKSVILTSIILFFISIFGYIGNSLSLNQLISKVNSNTQLPLNFKYAEKMEINNFGNSVFDELHMSRILKIKAFLDKTLDKNETFLNLTNRNALYFYLDRKSPIETGAFYNLLSEGQQQRAIEILAKDIPKVAILEADNFLHDNVKLPLRSPLLYRFVMQNYQPLEVDGIIYGIRNDMFNKFKEMISEKEQINLLEKVFSTSNLQFIPSEWGKSFNQLNQKLIKTNETTMESVHDLKQSNEKYEIIGNDPYIIYKLSENITGTNAGILGFEFDCLDNRKGVNYFEIYYKKEGLDFSESMVTRFSSDNNINIVPLDANPKYLNLKDIDKIRIDLAPNSSCKKFNILNVSLYQKRDIKKFLLDKEINLLGIKEYKLKPFPFTDNNWINGIAKDHTKFFITSEDYQSFNLKIGDKVEVETIGKVKILNIQKNGAYTNVEFEK